MFSFEEETIVDSFGEQIEGMSLYATQLVLRHCWKQAVVPRLSFEI